MKKIFLIALLTMIIFTGCRKPSYWLMEAKMAEVNGDVITFEDMKRSFEKGHGGHGAFLEDYQMNRDYLQKVIDKQLLVQEGLRIGLDNDEDIKGIIADSYNSKISELFYTEEIVKKVEVSEAEIKEAFEKSRNLYKVLYILVKEEDEAKKAIERIEAGEDFEKVAAEVSIHDSKKRGGKLGFIMWGVMVKEVEDVVLTMNEGEMKGPIKTKDGWAVVKVIAVEPQDEVEYEKVREELKNKVYNRKLENSKMEYFDSAKKRYNVEIFESKINPELFIGDENNDEMILASGEGLKLSVADLKKLINFKKLNKFPYEEKAKIVKEFLNNSVENKLLVLDAESKGYDKRDEIVTYVRRIRDSLITKKLLATIVSRDLEVTEEDIKSFYDEHKDKYRLIEKVFLNVIVVDSEEKAEEIKKQIEEEAVDFAEIAIKESKDSSGVNGGQVGWFSRKELRPSVVDMIFSLKENKIGIAKEEDGVYILMVSKRQEERQQEFDEVKPKVKKDAYKKKYNDNLKKWTQKLRETAEINIHNWSLKKATKVYVKENYDKKEKMKKMGGGH